ncbi:MAG: multiprotein-bridging factor 1 family protein, partial [Nanoarchaeota archaeon]
CQKCGTYGKVLARPSMPINRKTVVRAVEPTLGIVTDYAARIRKARERTGLNQKEFAATLNEKESIVHKLETGTYEPPIDLARKLERMLHITLIEEDKDAAVAGPKTGGGGMTIGDIMKSS